MIQDSYGTLCADRRPMGIDWAPLPWQAYWSGTERPGQLSFHRSGAVDCPDAQFVARSARPVRQLKHGVPPLQRWNAVPMFLKGFSMLFPVIRTWNIPWSMQRSWRFIAMVRVQKGDTEPIHRPLERRHGDEDSRADKMDKSFSAIIYLAATTIHSRWIPTNVNWLQIFPR